MFLLKLLCLGEFESCCVVVVLCCGVVSTVELLHFGCEIGVLFGELFPATISLVWSVNAAHGGSA